MLRQKNVIETLVKNYPLYNFEKRTNHKRLGNLSGVPIEYICKCVKESFECIDIEILPPSSSKNPSNTYECIRFVTRDLKEYLVINCNKENKGKIFEDSLYDLLAKSDPSVKPLLEYLGLDYNTSKYKVFNTGKVNTARNIYDSTKHSGEIISDITIVSEGVEHYLSLKAKNGTTIYSGKNVNFIVEEYDKIDFDDDKYFTSPHGILFDELNIDVYKVIDGLCNYKNNLDSTISDDILDDSTFNFIRKILINSWSYGYHLIYEHSDTVNALDLTKFENTCSLVGKINSARIVYPTYKTKTLTVKISVHNDILNVDDLYYIEFRNAKGKLLPLEMKVRKM